MRPFAGQTFNKREIENALHIGHSVANTDSTLFKDVRLDMAPKAKKWVQGDEDPKLHALFYSMTKLQWAEYLAEQRVVHNKAERKRIEEEKRIRKRKRDQESEGSEGDVSEEEALLQKRLDDLRQKKALKADSGAEGSSRGKGKGKAREPSEEIDY